MFISIYRNLMNFHMYHQGQNTATDSLIISKASYNELKDHNVETKVLF